MKKLICVLIVIFIAVSTLGVSIKQETESIDICEEEVIAIDRRDYWDEHPDEDPRPKLTDVYYLAKVVEAVCPDACVSAKTCVMEIMFNRVGQTGFGSNIKEIATQPYQWPGYSDNIQPSKENLELAEEIYDIHHSDGIYITFLPTSYKYFDVTPYSLIFRSEWDSTDFEEITFL